MTRNGSVSPIPALAVDVQFRWYKRGLPSLQSSHPPSVDASLLRNYVSAGYAGMVVIPKPTRFTYFNALVAIQLWDKFSDLKLVMKLPGVQAGSFAGSRVERYVRVPRTVQKLDELEKASSAELLVFPFRAVQYGADGYDTLDEGEFFLDMASMLWLIGPVTKIIEGRSDISFACLGERYDPDHTGNSDEIPIVAYEGHRRLYVRPERELNEKYYVLIGWAPKQ